MEPNSSESCRRYILKNCGKSKSRDVSASEDYVTDFCVKNWLLDHNTFGRHLQKEGERLHLSNPKQIVANIFFNFWRFLYIWKKYLKNAIFLPSGDDNANDIQKDTDKDHIVDINGDVQNENSRQSCLLQDCVSVPVLVQMEVLPPNLAMLHIRDLLWLWIIQAEHDFIFQGLFHLFHGIGKTKYRKKVV